MSMLIAARVLQGIGGGSVIALVRTVVADIAPGTRRGRCQRWFSDVYATASVMGPVLGDLSAEHIGCRGPLASGRSTAQGLLCSRAAYRRS